MGGSVVTNGAFNYAPDGSYGTDDYTITLSPAITALVAGMYVCFRPNTMNTGGATLNVCSLGAVNIVKSYSTTLATGDISQWGLCLVIYDGTNFVLMNPYTN